jgi:type IV secretion system protein TrbL
MGAARLGAGALRGSAALARGGYSAFKEGAAASGKSGAASIGPGLSNVARAGRQAAAERARQAWSRMSGAEAPSAQGSPGEVEPEWAKRMRKSNKVSDGLSAAAHTARSGDASGAGASPSLKDE